MEVQYSKNYFKFLLPQEARALGNNIESDRKSQAQNMYIIYLQKIFALPAIQCKWQFFVKMS